MSSTDPQPSPTPSTRPGLIRRTFRRHGKGMMAAWLLASLVAGAVAYAAIRPTYRAFSLLRVDPTVTDLYNTKPAGDPLEPYLQTQVELITSPNVLTAAGTNPKAAVLARVQNAGDVVLELKKAVSVSVRPGTYLIEVSMTSYNGYEAATIVNAVVDAFIEANSEWSDGMTRQQIKNLEQYSVDLKNQTDELERKWKNLAANGDTEIDFGAGKKELDVNRAFMTIEEYRQARQEYNGVKMRLAEAQAWLSIAKAAVIRAGKDVAPVDEREMMDRQVERRFKLDPEVATLLGEIKKAEAKLSDARRTTTEPEDPSVKAAKRKLDGLVEQYAQLWEAKSQALREQLALGGGNALDPDREIIEAQAAVNKLLAKQAALKTMFEQLDVKNKNQAADAVEIALIQDERATFRDMQVAVARRLEQLKYDAKGEARIRPVSPNGAMVPTRPISDARALVLPLIPLAMLFVAFGLFVGIEAFSGPRAATGKAEPTGEV